MASNISGLTCFALLNAMESDLRALVLEHCEEHETETIFDPQLLERAQERRGKDRGAVESSQLSAFVPYIDFADAVMLINKIRNRLPDALSEGIAALGKQLEVAVPIRNRVAHARPLEIDDLPRVVDLANALARVPGFGWPSLTGVRESLAENPAFVLGLTLDLVKDSGSKVSHNLPTADFDETGFLGRRDLRRQLGKALKGHWPVISVLGEGGIGKTALALQAAYDLLDADDCPYQAIVWTTAKGERLTTSEIQRIGDAILDSLGLFASAANQLAGTAASTDSFQEVLDNLSTFPILLVLDNLETVLDDRIENFLREVPDGSKVLITSRIGVQNQYHFNLGPLTEQEAMHLLRSLAKVRNVKSLIGLDDATAKDFVKRMNCHPGYIKWFVSGVQVGEAPERLLTKDQLLLEYCMSNVFDYLTDDARKVLQSMIVVPGSHTQADLAVLNDLDAARIQTVAYQLVTTNFVNQVRAGTAASPRTALALSDFARKYLQRKHPPSAIAQQTVLNRHRDLYKIGGDLQVAHSQDPYAPDTIEIRDSGDFSAARLLRSALDQASQGQYDQAIELCRQAIDLAPGYHEPHRVMAYVYDLANNFNAALLAYEYAADCAPENAHVQYFFGSFLLHSRIDPNRGLRTLQEAAKLDPDSAATLLAIAQAHLEIEAYLPAMDVAGNLLTNGLAKDDRHYQAIHTFFRASVNEAADAFEKGQWTRLVEAVERAVTMAEGTPLDHLDPYLLDLLMLHEEWAGEAAGSVDEEYTARRCGGLVTRIRERRGQASPDHLGRMLGRVKRILRTSDYAFVSTSSGVYFMHATSLYDPAVLYDLHPGSRVAFTPGAPPPNGHPPALEVQWVL